TAPPAAPPTSWSTAGSSPEVTSSSSTRTTPCASPSSSRRPRPSDRHARAGAARRALPRGGPRPAVVPRPAPGRREGRHAAAADHRPRAPDARAPLGHHRRRRRRAHPRPRRQRHGGPPPHRARARSPHPPRRERRRGRRRRARHLGTRVPAGVPAVRLGARARHLAHLLGGPAEPGRPVSAAPALPRGGARTGTRLLLRLLTILVVAAGVVVLGAALAHAAPVPPEDPVAPTEPVEPGLGINLDVGAATPSTS